MNKQPTIKQVKHINVLTRHWTDTYGNTYFTGELKLNGETVHEETFTYGYGDHALYTMVKNCVTLGKLPKSYETEVTWKYLDRVCGRKNWNHLDIEVSRKKDM